MKIYISGPIKDKPDANREAFLHAASLLRHMGHEPVNPHDVKVVEHDGPCPPGYVSGEGGHSSACYMKSDIAAMLDCDAIYLLDGWEPSQGAFAEFVVARATGMEMWYQR